MTRDKYTWAPRARQVMYNVIQIHIWLRTFDSGHCSSEMKILRIKYKKLYTLCYIEGQSAANWGTTCSARVCHCTLI